MKQMSIFDMVPEPSRTPPPAPALPPVPLAADAPEPSSMTEHVELELVLLFDNVVRGEMLVSKTGNEADGVWLRSEQVEFTKTGRNAPATTAGGKTIAGGRPVIAINLPEQMAREKGLL